MSEILALPTEQEQLALRQLTAEDAAVYYESISVNRDHLSRFGDTTAEKYPDIQSVEQSIRHPSNPDKVRMGIWDNDTFVGTINLTPDKDDKAAEIGYWLDAQHTGKGYATLATKALSKYAVTRFPRVYAEVVDSNEASVRVLERSGYKQIKEESGQLLFEMTQNQEKQLKSRGAGIIFHILPTDQFIFFLRDDKPGISCPNMIDIIGGHMENSETPEQTALREAGEELIDNDSGKPFIPEKIEHFKTWVDERPGEHNIFGCELDYVPHLSITEGQGLMILSRQEALATEFAYEYSNVVREYLEEN